MIRAQSLPRMEEQKGTPPSRMQEHKDTLLRELLIETIRKQKQGIVAPLLKYCYIGKGADRFFELTRNDSYTTTESELGLFIKEQRRLMYTFENIFPFTLFALGTGDGRKIVKLAEMASQTANPNRSSLGFIGVDISAEMLLVARSLFQEKRIKFSDERYYVYDFENKSDFFNLAYFSLADAVHRKILFVITGNTLANIPDHFAFLRQLADYITMNAALSKHEKDRHERAKPELHFLVSLELGIPDREKIIQEYASPEDITFLSTPLELLGLNADNGRIEITFSEEKKRIEANYICERTILLDNLIFRHGETILVGFSYKFDYNELNQILKDTRFSVELELMSEDKKHVLLVLKDK